MVRKRRIELTPEERIEILEALGSKARRIAAGDYCLYGEKSSDALFRRWIKDLRRLEKKFRE